MKARQMALGLLLGAASLILIANFRSYLRAAALVVAGRHNGCPTGMALRTPAAAQEETNARQRIGKASRRVEADPAGLELWETPAGRFWAPRRERSGYWLARFAGLRRRGHTASASAGRETTPTQNGGLPLSCSLPRPSQ